MRSHSFVGLLTLSIFLNACTPAPLVSTLDPLQLQAIQTQDIETTKRIAFASVVSVFQDLGFVIDEADIDTGLITAQGATRSKSDFWSGGTNMTASRATAFLEEIRPRYTRVRLNFVERHSTRTYYGGGTDNDIPNENADFYDGVFARIHEAVFIRSASE